MHILSSGRVSAALMAVLLGSGMNVSAGAERPAIVREQAVRPQANKSKRRTDGERRGLGLLATRFGRAGTVAQAKRASTKSRNRKSNRAAHRG